MAIWYRPIPGKPLFHVVYSGQITLHDVLGFFDAFEMDFKRHPEFDELCEMDHVTQIDVGGRDLRSLLALVVGIYRRNACRKRIAFLGGNDDIGHVLDLVVAQFDADYPNVRCQRFADRAQAYDYLDLPRSFAPAKGLH